jgi:hypothetical protein
LIEERAVTPSEEGHHGSRIAGSGRDRDRRFQGHLVPSLAITTAVTVPIMTWLVMPRVTRLLRGWLYPRSRSDRPASASRPDESVDVVG